MYTHLQRDQTRPPVTLATLARMKADGEKIASLTCYDASFAVLMDTAEMDVVLVGDSLGMVIQGHDTTVPVTMDQMVYHCAAAARLLEEARRLESAGADIVLLECIPAALGKTITAELHVPVIGIGAGPDTDGQILVTYDILDITTGRKPRFVRNFMEGAHNNLEALQNYVRAVKRREYPAPEHCF